MILKDNSSINKVDIKPKTQRHKKKISTKALTVLTHSLAKYRLKAQVEKDEGLSEEGQSSRVEKNEGPSGEG